MDELFEKLYMSSQIMFSNIIQELPPIDLLLSKLDFDDPSQVYCALSWDLETVIIVDKSLRELNYSLSIIEYIQYMLNESKKYTDTIIELVDTARSSLNVVANNKDNDEIFVKSIIICNECIEKIIYNKNKLHECSKGLNPDYIKYMASM